MLHKFFNVFVIAALVCSLVTPVTKAHADTVETPLMASLPEPGTMVNLSPVYEPILIKGLKVHPENPFLFDFIIDTGNENLPQRMSSPNALIGDPQQEQLKQKVTKLVKYFLAAITIPEKDLWVNLSPYEKNRMIASNLAQTEMGRDMLAEDYILKQLTASLIYPEKNLGKTFWDEVYAKALQLYGTTQVPVDTFNKVWIVADRADVYERDNVAYVVGAHLKVMLEEDYLALEKHSATSPLAGRNDLHSIGVNIVRKIILPEIENEVNKAKNFASLRQMFYSMILASWYKQALKNAILSQVYGNQSKVKVGINQANPRMNDEIFNRYLRAYKKGVFNFIKEDIDKSSGETIPRKYFSGGEAIWRYITPTEVQNVTAAMLSPKGHMLDAKVGVIPAKVKTKIRKSLGPIGNRNLAMSNSRQSAEVPWGLKELRNQIPGLEMLAGEESNENVRVSFSSEYLPRVLDLLESAEYCESTDEAARREAREEIVDDLGISKEIPESLRNGRNLEVSQITRVTNNGIIKDRISDIVRVPLTPMEESEIFRRIERFSYKKFVVALSGERVMELVKNGKDASFILDAQRDIIPFFLSNRPMTLSANSIEVIKGFFPINKETKERKQTQLRRGVFFQMIVHRNNKDYYVFEANAKGEVKPLGGAFQFRKERRLLRIDDNTKAFQAFMLLHYLQQSQNAGKLKVPEGFPRLELPDPQASSKQRIFLEGQEVLSLHESDDQTVKALYDGKIGIFYVAPLTLIVKEQGRTFRIAKAKFGRNLDDLTITKVDNGNTTNAMKVTPGGIDFNAGRMHMSIQKYGQGINMRVDHATIDRIKSRGFDGMEFNIRSIVPVFNLPMLLGLESGKEVELNRYL